VGEVTISALQMGDSRYHPAPPLSETLRIIHPVVKDDQVINFQPVSLRVRDDAPFQLSALATSSGINHPVYNLPVSFKKESGPANVESSGLVTLDGTAGTVTITAAQSGSAYVNPAPPVTISFNISSKQRPVILFPASASEGNFTDTPAGHRPLVIQGVSSTNGEPFRVTSSDSSIVSIQNGRQFVPKSPGTVTLTFEMPESEFYVAAETVQKKLTVVLPRKDAWKKFRKADVRYNHILSRFTERLLARNPDLNSSEAQKIFDEDYSDSDGDGWSNFFERAMGTDSLGPDYSHHLPQQLILSDNKQRMTFIRYISPQDTTGEGFEYHIEQSSDLQTWNPSGLLLENVVNLGDVMQRVTYVTSEALGSGKRKFIRLRISAP